MSITAAAQLTNHGMSTVMTHKAFGRNAEKALMTVRQEAARLEKLLSCFIPGSEISRINSSAGIKSESLSNETYEVLQRAVEFSRCSRGLFDVTIGPLVNLWYLGKDTQSPPELVRIKQVLPLVDYTSLLLEPCSKTARLGKPGQSINLGGIGKGFAGNKFVEVFRKYGVISAFTNIGGNVVALGTKPDGSLWRVGIQHPRQSDCLLGSVSVADKAVVTSGDYQRYFLGSDGKRYHHILDTATGYPVESGLASVTVIADSSMDADALSTILFAAGMKNGLKFLRQFNGAEAIFSDMDSRVYITDGLKEYFQAGEGIRLSIIN